MFSAPRLAWFASQLAFVSILAGCPDSEPDPSTPDAGGTAGFPDATLTGTPEERGADLYRGLRCVNCHGVDGRGTPSFPGAPTVVGRGVDDLRLALVRACEDPSSTNNCHPLKIEDLREQQLVDLAAYLTGLANADTVEDPGPPCTETPGEICTLAGNGVAGSQSQPGLLARQQYLFWPQDATTDPQGRVVITDWNNYVIRRIETEGCREGDCPVTSLIGSGGLGDDCSTAQNPVPAVESTMNHPVGLYYDRLGNIVLWGWHQWKIKYVPVNPDGTTGQLYCLFGNERGFSGDGMEAGFNFDGMRGPTRFNLPSSAVQDRAGHFYISDQGNLRIRRIVAGADDDYTSAESVLRTYANNIIETWGGGLIDPATGATRRTRPDYSDSGDGGPVSQATFNVQAGFDAIPQMRLAIDDDRNLLYVADSENHRIRVIDLNQDPPIIDTFAGGGTNVTGTDIPAGEARLYKPGDVDVAPDGSGDVLITDTYNHCVRLVNFATKRIHTVAGQCGVDTAGYEGDGGPATAARLNEPGGAGIGPDRKIYIADTLSHRIRKVNPTP